MSSYEAFFPEVLPFFPGVPEIIVTNAIRNACIDFCERTDWLLYTPIEQQLKANENEYDLTIDVPDDTTPCRIQSIWAYQLPLLPKSEEDLRRIFTIDWRKQLGRPAYYTQYVAETVIICPRPTETSAAALSMTLVVRPSRASTTVDDTIYERWAEVIAAGARARLHQIPGQQYESADMAARYLAIFNQGCDKAVIERQRGLSRAVLRVRPPRTV